MIRSGIIGATLAYVLYAVTNSVVLTLVLLFTSVVLYTLYEERKQDAEQDHGSQEGPSVPGS